MSRRRRLALIALSSVLLLTAGIGAVWTLVLVARAEARFPARGAFVDLPGGRIRALDTGGPGRPVVLLHGAFGGLEDWTASGVVASLQAHGDGRADDRRLRVVAFDRPGHGYSERAAGPCDPIAQAEILAAAADELGIRDPVVVGFSYGGAVALAWAIARPDQVAALALVNPSSHPWGTGHDLVYDLVCWPAIGALAAHTWLTPSAIALAPATLANAFAPEPVPDAFRDGSPWPLALRPDAFRRNAEDVRSLEPALARLAPRYASIGIEAVILVSRDDRVVGPRIHSDRLHASMPASELVELTGTGHQLPYTCPAAVVDAILRAVDRAE